jgi:hypothetical protein
VRKSLEGWEEENSKKTNYRPKKTVKTAKEHTPFRNQKTSPVSKMNLYYTNYFSKDEHKTNNKYNI